MATLPPRGAIVPGRPSAVIFKPRSRVQLSSAGWSPFAGNWQTALTIILTRPPLEGITSFIRQKTVLTGGVIPEKNRGIIPPEQGQVRWVESSPGIPPVGQAEFPGRHFVNAGIKAPGTGFGKSIGLRKPSLRNKGLPTKPGKSLVPTPAHTREIAITPINSKNGGVQSRVGRHTGNGPLHWGSIRPMDSWS